MKLDDDAYAKLKELCRNTPHRLRERAYDYVPETMEQLKRWKRDDLIPFLFQLWLEKRDREIKCCIRS